MKKEKEISQKKEQELKQMFDLYDEDGSGFLEVAELIKAFPNLFSTFDEVNKMIANYDENADNCLDFDEFIEFMAPTHQFNS